MVSSTLLSLALSCGIFGLQASAGPLPGFNGLPPVQAIRTDDLHEDGAILSHVQRRAVNQSLGDAIELVPIREEDLLPRHLRKREDDLSRLDLVDQVRMMYGGLASQEQMYLANMTLYAPSPDHPLIMMEKFDGLTESVNCASQDNQITLKFVTKEAMDYAIHAWDWVNAKDTDCFYLIANHKGCGIDDQRHPYRIVDVEYNEETFTTVLTSQTISWDDIASNFDINLGRASIPPTNRLTKKDLTKRGFWDIFPKIDFKKSVHWDLSTPTKGKKIRLFTDPFHEFAKLQLDCADCYISGGLEFTGHIRVKGFKVEELYIGARPKGLRARLELQVIILAGIPKPGINMKATLYELGIPGLSIPNIFSLGPSFQYQVGFETALYGIGNFSVGVDVNVPGVAAVVGDLLEGENSGANGWEGLTVDPIFRINDISATAYSAVYAQPVLAFGIKILNRWGFEAALSLKLPWIAADVTVGYNADGLCLEKDKSITTGVKTKGGINIELWFNAGMVGGPKIIPSFNKKLWGVRYPFWEMCFPFQFPGMPHGQLPPPPTETLPLSGAITEFVPSQTPYETNIMEPIIVTRTYLPPNFPVQPTGRPFNGRPVPDSVNNEKPKGGPHNDEPIPEAVPAEEAPVVTAIPTVKRKVATTSCTKARKTSTIAPAATPYVRRVARRF
ncbi:hypothetical protein ABW19_dt0200546 [Dactylella cylindrospora]|nr:hypothetical protein ABW19_dt0200546 [Dactylella cylindrospora]